jgi:hypothetical protein
MEKIIKKLFCLIWGHNFYFNNENDIVCKRCGKKGAEPHKANSFFLGDIQINDWEDIDATIDN